VLADEWIQAAQTGRNRRHLRAWMGVPRGSSRRGDGPPASKRQVGGADGAM